MLKNKYAEVVIVGAGASGLACARILALSGIEVIVLERSTRNSTKSNLYYLIQKERYESIFGSFPTNTRDSSRRDIKEFRVYLINDSSFTSVSYKKDNKNYLSIQNDYLNNYILKSIEKSNVKIYYETVVREIIYKNSKICGVRTDNDEFNSDVVVISDGINSLLAKNSGLRSGNYTPNEVFIFLEENIFLKEEIMGERFQIQNNSGIAAKIFITHYLKVPSIAFIQTNKDSITLSCGVLLSESIRTGININEFQEKLKTHPTINSLINGGITKSYRSYILPCKIHTHKNLLPRLYTNSCIVTGGAAALINVLSWDLSGLALTSGKLAADTIINAKKTNNYSEKNLSAYKRLLEKENEFKELMQKKNLSLISAIKNGKNDFSQNGLQSMLYKIATGS